jgi:hypothetical protein
MLDKIGKSYLKMKKKKITGGFLPQNVLPSAEKSKAFPRCTLWYEV